MGDESGKTDSGEVEKVDFEDVELLIDLKKKAKGKKRKATLLMQRANPPRETSRKSSVPEAVPSKTPTASASVGGSKAKLSRKTANAKLLAEQRYESFSYREIIPERSIDPEADDMWRYLEVIRRGHPEKTVTGLGGYVPEIVKKFYASLPGEMTKDSEVTVSLRGLTADKLSDRRNTWTVTKYLSPCKAALVILSSYNWVPSSHKNVVSVDRTRLSYKIKKGKDASNSKTSSKSGPPPSASRSKPSRKPSSPDKGYVPPHQSLRPVGKFQIIHLGAIACPGEPVDVEEAKIALDGALVSIQQLAVAMEALTSVVSHIAQMVHPRGENEQNPQRSDKERDDQET
ncbi:hypothetical protein DY000_02030688 [Brassica cretica]|uniref:Uncharacterized protein n=1 Tax=Brassica cretica TaxID=69181 RepID=A0ABQ7DZD3_BRACR|nr:hypothetical protein DY000_02030688 [Brassica cretica]